MVRRNQPLRVSKSRRIYDRTRNRFSYDIAFKTDVPFSQRSVAVAEAFGLGLDQARKFVVLDNVVLEIKPREVVLITGDSGSGKSVLLRALQADLGAEACDMAKIEVVRSKPIIETIGMSIDHGLELLSRVGLNDAFLFLRSYDQLSDGQKYRYRIAKMIDSGAQWWFCDEFCASLDRDTAKIVAFNLQKFARALGKALIVATTHEDLEADLRPSVHVHKRFGSELSCTYESNDTNSECSLVSEMQVKPGTREDWLRLEAFHYRSGALPAAIRKIFSLWRGSELCGVIVYNYPPSRAAGRNAVMGSLPFSELNKRLSTISRVVVHPKYRSIGLGAKLVRETLPLCGTECVEMVAVMAKYNPFAERAGMRRVCVSSPAVEAVRISRVLVRLGFDLHLLGCRNLVENKFSELSSDKICEVKAVFKANGHPRLRNCVAGQPGVAYGKSKDYRVAVNNATPAVLTNLAGVCGLLLQSKAYLFWRKEDHKP